MMPCRGAFLLRRRRCRRGWGGRLGGRLLLARRRWVLFLILCESAPLVDPDRHQRRQRQHESPHVPPPGVKPPGKTRVVSAGNITCRFLRGQRKKRSLGQPISKRSP